MHHFVGFAEDGAAIYKDGCTDEVCALTGFVGQVIDLSTPGEDDDHISDLRDMVIAHVGALIPTAQGPSRGAPVAQRQVTTRALPMSSTAPNYPTAPTAPTTTPAGSAPAVPYWACYGRMEGGFYANNPTPGATFEQCAFTREVVQPGEDIAQQYTAPVAWNPMLDLSEGERSGSLLRNFVSGVHRFVTGQWAHGNAAPLPTKPPRTGPLPPGAYAANKGGTRPAGVSRQGGSGSGGRTSQRAASCAAHQAYSQALQDVQCVAQGADPSQYSMQTAQAAQNMGMGGGGGGYGGGGGGGGGGDYSGDCCEYYCEGPQGVPPGYCFVPYGPEDQGEEGGEDYCCDEEGGDCCGPQFTGAAMGQRGGHQAVSSRWSPIYAAGAAMGQRGGHQAVPSRLSPVYAAGQAPQGLGAGIGGALGGILGMFIGAPELTAPIGGAIGGAIQGAACHQGGNPGWGQPAQQTKAYTANGAQVTLHGSQAPDGLFDPGPGEAGPMATVVAQANAIIRKNSSGTAANPRTRARVGQDAEQVFDDTPRFQAGLGWDDLDRLQDSVTHHVQDAADWIYDEGDALVQHAVGGGPGAKDFGPYSQGTIQSILQGLRNAGYDVSGGNPYDVDVKQHGVKLAATVHGDGTVTIAIASSAFYVTHDQVWEKVGPLMPAAG